jgi:uncharacterized protein YdeI (YjbR/CyaY-like superfamily)
MTRVGKKDPRVDACIARSAAFAKPILSRIRAIVHEACPEVEETITWGSPFFMYRGMLCNMAAFKSHCTFGLLHASLRQELREKPGGDRAMGTFGRITALGDLPADRTLADRVREAMKLNEEGVTPTSGRQKKEKGELAIPADLADGLKNNRKASVMFEGFSFSKKRDYIEWLTEAKSEATRQKRLATAREWISEGKERN